MLGPLVPVPLPYKRSCKWVKFCGIEENTMLFAFAVKVVDAKAYILIVLGS